MKIILASKSPRRQQLLKEMKVRFEALPAEADEHNDSSAGPKSLVIHNARLKAEAVADLRPGNPVIGSDTTVFIDDQILNKPVDMDDARRMLKLLSGRTHTVYTAVSLIFRERNINESICITSDVTFYELDEGRINRYFQIVDPLDKAGSYGIQEGHELIIASYKGSFTNIMGLPVEATKELLEKFSLLEDIKL